MSYREHELNCPGCGSRIDVVCLYSYPAHYEAYCSNHCGFTLKYSCRKNSYVTITQVELDNYKGQK